MDGCWPQALARAFDTLVLDDVPQLSAKRHNEAARFVTLVDELYEARCRVVCWSAVPLAKLFDGGTEVKVTADGAAATPFNIRQSNEGREAERAARDELLGVEPAAAEAPTAGAGAGAGAGVRGGSAARSGPSGSCTRVGGAAGDAEDTRRPPHARP